MAYFAMLESFVSIGFFQSIRISVAQSIRHYAIELAYMDSWIQNTRMRRKQTHEKIG